MDMVEAVETRQTTCDKAASWRCGQTLGVPPANLVFSRLWRDADRGDPGANRMLGKLIDEAPFLLGSMVDLFCTAREFERNDMMRDDSTYLWMHRAEINTVVEMIRSHHANDLSLTLAAELVAICYFDAMRWKCFALECGESGLTCDYSQGMALSSLQKLAAMSRTYCRLVQTRGTARQAHGFERNISPVASLALNKSLTVHRRTFNLAGRP
ncbi:hypothetical protein Mal15_42540 [Stieleria maiorica]|uniref:Uncharacterized protein n=1 Tax=Stieleria maiorica TaxID=2795974 RepID=A0A5B9MKK1_9BACT|nr:hypothetical protein Mal15_42540 [Stieleria maiorica]